MASQSWRQYGSMTHNETTNNGYFNNLVVDNLTLRNHYSGFLNVNGALSVTNDVTFASTLDVADDVNLSQNLTVQGPTLLNNTLVVNNHAYFQQQVDILGDLNIQGAFQFYSDIRSVGNLAASGTSLTLGFGQKGTSTIDCNNAVSQGGLIGINTPIDQCKVLPGSALDVYNNARMTNTALNVYNGASTICQSVLVSSPNSILDLDNPQNASGYLTTPRNGIIAYTDPTICSINFFTSSTHSIPTTTTSPVDSSYSYLTVDNIAPNTGDLSMMYESTGKTLTINGQLSTIIPSSLVLGALSNRTQFNETLSLYTDTNISQATSLFPKFYDISKNTYSAWNTMTMIAPGSNKGTSTFLNMVNANNTGMIIGGGTYINDKTRSVGIIGVTTDNQTNWVPSQMIVSGSNPAYCLTTTGINKFAPTTETYALDINGAVNITSGEIVPIQQLSYEVTRLISGNRIRSVIIAVGSPQITPIYDTVTSTTNYLYQNYISNNSGITWNPSQTFSNVRSTLANSGYIYDSSYSILSYGTILMASCDGNNSWNRFNINDTTYLASGSISRLPVNLTFSDNCSAIRIFDFPNSANLIVFTTTTLSEHIPYPIGKQYVYYTYLANITNLRFYSTDSLSKTSFVNVTKFPIDISLVAAIDGYDTSYLFVTGSSGIYKYSINTSYCDDIINGRQDGCNLWVPNTKANFTIYTDPTVTTTMSQFIPGQTINHTASSTHNIGTYNYIAMQTYKSYDTIGNLQPDAYFSVFVGNGILTSTTDGGNTYRDVMVPDISFTSVYVHDSQQAIATATGGVIYTTHNGGMSWSSAYGEFNASGVASNLLMNSTCNLTSVAMSSKNDLIISRVDVSYNLGSQMVPHTNLYYCHLPSLFNRQYSSILDICGSMCTYGYSYVQNDLTVANNAMINGSITVNRGSVQMKQGFANPSDASGATVMINGGVGIIGNVVMGNSLYVQNMLQTTNIQPVTTGGNINIDANNGYINIGSFSTTDQTNSINIGNTNDNIVLSGSIVSTGALSTTANKLSLSINGTASAIGNYAGLTIGGNTTIPSSGYVMTDAVNQGFLMKAPLSSTSADIWLNSLSLNSTVKHGLLTIASSSNTPGYSTTGTIYDPSYIITSCPAIDISNIILSNGVNSINNQQTIGTDVWIQGNLTLSNSNGTLQISPFPASSTSTGTGSLIVRGGVGISGNIYAGENVKISGNLQVAGNTALSNHAIIGNTLTIGMNNNNPSTPTILSYGGIQTYGNITVKSDIYTTGNCFINVGYGYDGNGNYVITKQTLLSMTDFSSNVLLHSTSDALNTASGSLQVMGGAGIQGNIFVGGNAVILGNIPSNGTKSGALQVMGGAGISGNIFVGGNAVILGNIPSNGTKSGALQVMGGAGISGNVFVGGNTVILGGIQSNSTSTGSLQVVGGAGISANVYVGGTVSILSGINSTGTSSGSLQVNGGVGISKDMIIGGNISIGGSLVVQPGPDATSCYTGVTMGGLGVQGNLFINNQTYSGANADLLAGLVMYYPFSTDISNYASGTPISDMIITPSANWPYSFLSGANTGKIGSTGGGALDISWSGTSANCLTNYILNNYPTIPNLRQFTVSFWLSLKDPLNTTGSYELFSFLNISPVGTITGKDSIIYAKIVFSSGNSVMQVSSTLDQASSTPSYSSSLDTNGNWNLYTFNINTVDTTVAIGDTYTTIDLYINGIKNQTFSINTTSYTTTTTGVFQNCQSMNIGYKTITSMNYHYLMNDFRIYNRTLAVPEILQIYRSTGLTTWATNIRYNETNVINPDNTTYTTTPSFTTTYNPMTFPPYFTSGIAGNLAVTGQTNLRGNTTIQGDLNITGYVLQNGVRLGYDLTESTTIVAGSGGYFGGNLLTGSVYLNKLKLGTGGYFGGSTTVGDISLNSLSLGTGGYFGGSATTGNILLNSIMIGTGGYFGGSTSTGNIMVNTATVGNLSISQSTASGALQIYGGVGIGGNIHVGGSQSKYWNTTVSTSTGTGVLLVNGGVGIGGNTNVGGSQNTFSSTTVSTSTGTGVLLITGGVGIGGNINVGGTQSIFSGTTASTSTGTGVLLITGGIGIGGSINVGGSQNILSSTTASTSTGTGALLITGGVGIGGSINVGGIQSIFSNTAGSTTTSTGAVLITGGVGIGGSINVGGSQNTFSNTAVSTSTSTGAVLITGGVGIGGSINVGGTQSIFSGTATSTSTSTGALIVNGGAGIGGSINVGGTQSIFSGTAASTSTSTGALIVNGGVGIGGSINVGGTQSIFSGTATSTSTSTGALVVAGGIGIGGSSYAKKLTIDTNLTIGTNGVNATISFITGSTIDTVLKISNTTDSSSKTTGALIVSGGAGINNNLYVGGDITVGGKTTATSFNATSDYRIKKDIYELDSQYVVDKLRPVKYENMISNVEHIGFLAHEVQEIYPYLVSGKKDGEETQTLNYDGIIGILVNEIKMLKKRVEILEKR